MRQAERAAKCGLLLQRQAQLNNRRADSSIFMNLGRRSSNRRYTRATKWIPLHAIIQDSQQPVLNSPYPHFHTDIPVASLTRQQLANFLQFDFKRLVEAAGIKGSRIHMERATTADYEKVLGDIAACLRTAGIKAA